MKAVQIVKPNQLEVIDIEKPVIDPKNNVLVKMTAAGICGSDVGIYHGTNAAATYPRIIGHEMVGVVAEVGDNVSSFKNRRPHYHQSGNKLWSLLPMFQKPWKCM